MSDALWGDRRFRTFNVVNHFNREVLAIEVDFNLPAAHVVRTLERIEISGFGLTDIPWVSDRPGNPSPAVVLLGTYIL